MNSTAFSDDFSNSSLQKWTSARDNGSYWVVQNGKLHVEINESFTLTELIPSDNYWNTDLSDYQFDFEFRALSGTDKNIAIVYTDNNNWIDLHLFNDNYEVAIVEDGILTYSYKGTQSFSNGQTYHFSVIKSSNNVKIFLDHLLFFDESHTAFGNSGRISLRASTGAHFPTEIEFDNIVVRSLDPAPLEFPHFKQTDPLWASEEYDHASQWSNTGFDIDEYGCAVSSMAMILHAHGILQLPDGSIITPSTLNAWLRTQPDGYIGEGLLNFAAVTRLSRILNQQYGTTKLEYSRVNGPSLDTAEAQIQANKPVMVQIPGHFLVGYGTTEQDILIKDPAYTYAKFSEHNKPLLSTRLFTPSNTDLSYIVIAHNPSIQISVYSSTGILVAQSNLPDYVSSATQNQSSGEYSLLEYEKPQSDTYTLSVSGSPYTTYTFKIYTYTSDGEVTIEEHTGAIGQVQPEYELIFATDEPAVTEPTSSWEQFSDELEGLYENGQISKRYIAIALQQYADHAHLFSPTDQRLLIIKKRALLDFFSEGNTNQATELLLRHLQYIENDTPP